MSWFYIVPFSLIGLVLLFLFLLWLRKIQHDAIHRNFLGMEDKFQGKVIRNGWLARPYFAGKVNNRELRVGFTSEKYKGVRSYYIHYTLECNAKIKGSIIQNKWYQSRDEQSQNEMEPLLNKEFWLQLKGERDKKFKNLLEKHLKTIPVFSYALIANTGIILERFTDNLIEDKQEKTNNKVIIALVEIAKLFEKNK